MKEHFFDFMQKVIDNHQAEPAPQIQPGQECWYLPTFGVYHPQKPGKIRVFFLFKRRVQRNITELHTSQWTQPKQHSSWFSTKVQERANSCHRRCETDVLWVQGQRGPPQFPLVSVVQR